jgi:hypothetical protein
MLSRGIPYEKIREYLIYLSRRPSIIIGVVKPAIL